MGESGQKEGEQKKERERKMERKRESTSNRPIRYYNS